MFIFSERSLKVAFVCHALTLSHASPSLKNPGEEAG